MVVADFGHWGGAVEEHCVSNPPSGGGEITPAPTTTPAASAPRRGPVSAHATGTTVGAAPSTAKYTGAARAARSTTTTEVRVIDRAAASLRVNESSSSPWPVVLA